MSSFLLTNLVKKRYGFKKVGHTGTLDPLAEGVMVLLTDSDTKKQPELTALDKVYQAEIILGATTPSFDLETEVSFSDDFSWIPEARILEVLKMFVGEVSLPAPIFSAKKVAGKRLYSIARTKVSDFDLVLPTVNSKIFAIKLISYLEVEFMGKKLPLLKIEVSCSSGTYIRSLVDAIGRELGPGAVLTALCRTAVGPWKQKDSQDFREIRLL